MFTINMFSWLGSVFSSKSQLEKTKKHVDTYAETFFTSRGGKKTVKPAFKFPKVPKFEKKGKKFKERPLKHLPTKREVKDEQTVKLEKQNRKDVKEKGKQSWESKLEEQGGFVDAEPAEQRLEKVLEEPKKVNVALPFQVDHMKRKRRHLLFMNPGDEAIKMAIGALVNGWELPKWALPFAELLTVQGANDDDEKLAEAPDVPVGQGRLFFDGKPMALTEEKREAVKQQYFNPKSPSTIQPITDTLRETWANIRRSAVQKILMTFETYQLNFGRRHPPKVLGKMNLNAPGILAMDMFFPSKTLGWRKINVLCCMDTWSRFCRCYALERKDAKSTSLAMTRFLQEFASKGHMPRRILADKGTDLAPAKTVIERYRMPKDGNRPMVYHSATGTPVNIIEAMNAQVQRRLQVFRTAGITDDVSTLLEDITDQLNNQKRPDRANMSALQLLTLTKEQRIAVNAKHKDRSYVSEVPGLKPIFVGDKCRILLMTRKEQVQNKLKGFAPKWSKTIYTLIKKRAIPKNKTVFRYWVGAGQFYYRHELLKIPKSLDKNVITDYVSHKENVLAPEEEQWEDDFQEGAYDSDDSRY